MKICAALNVDCDTDSEFMRRVREKKFLLCALTDDKRILDNVAGLVPAILILCSPLVVIRVPGVKYVGVLSTPTIKIRAQSQTDLDAQKISFANVRLPWQKTSGDAIC